MATTAPLLGCIADDFTGATDLANTLVRQGMRTVQWIGVPRPGQPVPETDAIVVALKSRAIPVTEAVDASRRALTWLREAGCRQFFFKYCSTFDSTREGNIGPVLEALLADLGADFTIACPAFPENGRTVYQGYLFVGDQLLSESHMRHHPITPMTDANLLRVLGAQTNAPVGLVKLATVSAGAEAVRERCQALRGEGIHAAIVDAVSDQDLWTIGEACAALPLVTGGSGVALGLPENFRRQGLLPPDHGADLLEIPAGRAAVLAGSCSSATLEQIRVMGDQRPSFLIDPLHDPDTSIQEALTWAGERLDDGPVLIYASQPPEVVAWIQAALGREQAGERVEFIMAALARGLVQAGVRRLVVAGGETAGAVVQALGIQGLRIGPQIDPGVPWTTSLGEPALALALKSGNFGSPGFFMKALSLLDG
jgi:uncharacterized protein YgbK (DUF1537 family)